MALVPWRDRAMTGSTLATLRDEMNDLWSRFWMGATEPFGLAEWAPALDVSETDDAVLIHAEIPGIETKDLDISITGDVLTLRGEKREEIDKHGKNFHRVERRYGAFTRSLTLPAPVNADQIEAKTRNGVLEIRLPKSEKAKARRVEVKEA